METEIRYAIDDSNVDSSSHKDLFSAILKYDFNKLESLLDEGGIADVNIPRDENKRSPLHVLLHNEVKGHLNEANMLQCLQLLISRNCDVNIIDEESGECPLSVAVYNSFQSAAKLLVKNGAKSSMRTPKFGGAGSLALAIAKTMPDVMMEILDQGVSLLGVDSEKPTVKLDWGVVVQYAEFPETLKKYGTYIENETRRETLFLLRLLDALSSETLANYVTHPLVDTFLFLKGKKLRKRIACCQLYSIFFSIFYMWHTYILYFKKCQFRTESNKNLTTTTEAPGDNDPFSQKCTISLLDSSVAYVLLLVVVLHEYVALRMHLNMHKKILQSFGFWVIQITLVIMCFTLWPALALQEEGTVVLSWQYPIAAMGTFFGWVMFLIQLELSFKVKLYLEMLVSVIARVVKIMVIFLPLMTGFYMALDLVYFERFNVMKFIFMTVDVGSDEYDNFINRTDDMNIWLTIFAYVFTVAFVIVIAVVFMNFLLAASIDDIQQSRNIASVRAWCHRVQIYFMMDVFFPTKNQVTKGGKIEYSVYDPSNKESEIPVNLIRSIFELAKERYFAETSK